MSEGARPGMDRLRVASTRSAPVRTGPPLVGVLTALLVAVAVGIASAIAVSAETPTYQSTATLLIDQPSVLASTPDAGEVAKLIALRIKYADLVGTQLIAQPVASSLGLPAGRVAGSLFAVAPPESLLLYVGARTSNPTLAHDLANATSAELRSYALREQSRSGVSSSGQFVLTSASSAGPAVLVAPSTRRITVTGVALGALVFLVGLALAYRRELARWI